MGSYSTLIRQCAVLSAAMAALTWAAPPEACGWVAATGVVALAFFLGVSLYRHRQVQRLADEVDEVLHSGRRVDFTSCREGDVAVLSNELAKMVARLARTRDQLASERNALADALADVSHQIRTPLTAITLMLPVVERADAASERKRAVRELEGMIERVSWLVTTLLKIAKVDAGAMRVQRHSVSAAEVARRAVAPLETVMDIRDVALSLDLDEAATFQGDELWTAEAVENIVKNCMEHTPAGGTVTVRVREDALATSIVVSDTGPGIAPKDLPHIFERFYRGSDSSTVVEGCQGSGCQGSGDLTPPTVAETRASSAPERDGASERRPVSEEPRCAPRRETFAKRDTPSGRCPETFAATPESVRQPAGFGIGLSLALALVSAQGGTLRAANNPQGGARFEIAFPKLVV